MTQIRSTDLVQPAGTTSGTTGTAKADFLAEGIHIKTTNASDAARGYWKVGVPLSRCTRSTTSGSARATPRRPTPASGIYYNIDIDGDGKADGQLIGELAYGGKDVWLNRDAEDFAGVTPTVPAGTFAVAVALRRRHSAALRRTATWTAARRPAAPATQSARHAWTTGTAASPLRQDRQRSSPPASSRTAWSTTASCARRTFGPEPVRLHQHRQVDGSTVTANAKRAHGQEGQRRSSSRAPRRRSARARR